MKNKILGRYCVFLAGLLLNAFGVAFITKASLGTTPIASIPYTLSLIFPSLTIGNFTVMVSLLLIAAQPVILRREAKVLDIVLQVPLSFIFGYVIDLSMLVLGAFEPRGYIAKFGSMLLGCVIIGLGAYLEVAADVTMLPADGFSRALSKALGKNFGTVKMITDSSQAAIAMLLGFIFLGGLAGVREGTVIGALLIGNLVKVFGKIRSPQKMFA